MGKMADRRVLVDTGPLVALLNVHDARHDEASAVAGNLPKPLITTWLVLGEAAWLLRRTRAGIPALLSLLDEGVVDCVDLPNEAARSISEIAMKYADLSPQLADLSLLYLAESRTLAEVFTFDRRDFSVYRLPSGSPLTLVPG